MHALRVQAASRAFKFFQKVTDMAIQDLTNKMVRQLNIDQQTAEKVVGTILSVIQIEGDGRRVGDLFDKLPGASRLARQYSVANVPSPAAFDTGVRGHPHCSLRSRARTSMAGVAQLQRMGLTMNQIRSAGKEFFIFATERSGRSLVKQVTASIAGLRRQLAA
jgi:hypothetical protein